ncbi:hypothetical protein [Pseudomonas monteilii]|uniref:hypothetical protein n=1 Tax=Pseudomonas monteilii TaxID=76759 RepID=UPI0018A929F2|nr:hypothetical protein [Pseudomonas monteilii]MBF8746860.1 hypothetical protein [Pseudomonas monteilii]
MIKIDWRMAPDWADGHGLIAFQGFTEVWISAEQYSVVGREGGPYPWGGGKGDTRHNHTRGQVQYITPRPERWDGTGLPPVGAVCERRFHDKEGSSWQRVTITAHGHKKIMCLEETGDEWAHFGLEVSFRPARTPEQIAEEERLAGLNEMIGHIKDHPLGTHGVSHLQELMIHEDVARDLWDAGYRKQEAS